MAHLHLLLNHLPVIGTVIGVAILAYALRRGSDELVRVGLALLIVLAAAAVGVYFTGEPAEEIVEDMAGVTESAIERHEEAALFATISMAVVAVAASAGLVAMRRRGSGPGPLARAALLLGLVATAGFAYTAYLGGQIRHPEARASGLPTGGTAASVAAPERVDQAGR